MDSILLSGVFRIRYILDNFKDGKCIVVLKNNAEIDEYCNEFSLFTKELIALPFYELNQPPFEESLINTDILENRIKVLYRLLTSNSYCLVTTSYALIKKIPSSDILKNAITELKTGMYIERERLLSTLDRLGYINVEIVTAKGEFSLKGEVLEIYPIACNDPIKIEFFDDCIERIASYNIFNHKTTTQLENILLYPCSEGIYTTCAFKDALHLDPIINEKIELYGKFAGHHWYAPLVNDMSSIFDLIGDNFKLANFTFDKDIDDLFLRVEEAKNINNYSYDEASIFLRKSELNRYLDNAFISISENKSIEPDEQEAFKNYEAPTKYFIPDKFNFYKNIDNFALLLKKLLKDNFKIIVSICNEKFLDIFKKILLEHNISYNIINSGLEAKKNYINIYQKQLSDGFIDHKRRLAIFAETNIFGFRRKRRPRKQDKSFKTTILDLEIGDYVVHITYGIAIFKGLVSKTIGGRLGEFLELEYDNKEILYVPTDMIKQIQKYVGGANQKKPKLSSLRSSNWNKLKKRAYKSAKKVAEDLLKLYSERKAERGYPFKIDRLFLSRIENTFEYDETEDQLTALMDIYRDMESKKPMERLICGDVGFGKTEVAIRAACIATSNYKQVAILCPTTVLAYQHYETFKKRFANLPVKVDYLCRFRSKKEVKDIKERVHSGDIDIIIGTHMLLAGDIAFRDLGLLIIDEEQRFGVSHKEKLTAFKKNIDVLTLTATPIPRTLQLSLAGIKDLSIIETPPVERYPVVTKIINKENEIDKAITYELKRGGQVFYIHNDIFSIEKIAYKLKERFPFARITIAHAKLPTNKLEKIFSDFYLGKIDILISTTIVENGIDVANANTMIIDDAQHFGLSQLYQLKGRVGRSNKRAYFYIYLKDFDKISPLVKKRLKIIQQLSDLGSGFKIASYDLQLRGAGDILGAEQSGYIDVVGYELYMHMITNAISEMKGALLEESETEINSNIPYYIPASYIEDYRERLEYYRAIGELDLMDKIFDLSNKLEESYGEIPEEVKNYIYIMFIKNKAEKLMIKRITIFSDSATLYFSKENKKVQNLFMYYNNDYVIQKLIKDGEIKIYTKRHLLPDLAVAINDVYDEYFLSLVS